jgi:hypothetical protein
MGLIDIPRLDPAKVYTLRWVPTSRDSYRELFEECAGLSPGDAEVVHLTAQFGTAVDLFLRCGNCGPAANPLRLVPGVSLACSKCYTVYRLEV